MRLRSAPFERTGLLSGLPATRRVAGSGLHSPRAPRSDRYLLVVTHLALRRAPQAPTRVSYANPSLTVAGELQIFTEIDEVMFGFYRLAGLGAYDHAIASMANLLDAGLLSADRVSDGTANSALRQNKDG